MITRRVLLGAAAGSVAVAALPAAPRAQARTIKIGVISPVTGALAEIGQDCRLGAQMAVEAINATSGIRSQGGARLELLLADSQTKADVARAAYTYEAILVMADVLERAGATDADALVAAIKNTSFDGGVTTATGPVIFNELGDNPNASTAAIQILGGKPRVVWPREAAEVKFVFPTSRFRR